MRNGILYFGTDRRGASEGYSQARLHQELTHGVTILDMTSALARALNIMLDKVTYFQSQSIRVYNYVTRYKDP